MNQDRREFLGTALMTIVAAKLGMTEPRSSFGPVKQIDAGVLNVGYVEAGRADAPAVVLLHGWPYDIYSFEEVAPLLAAKGYRVIVPYLRGYGTTRFLSNDTFRNGQPSALAVDIVALMDALKIEKGVIGGVYLGARAAGIMAAAWAPRRKAIVSPRRCILWRPATRQNTFPPA